MLQGIGPKFVEPTGKQLVCPYCQYKFRAPQGTRDQISNYYLVYFRHKVYIGVLTFSPSSIAICSIYLFSDDSSNAILYHEFTQFNGAEQLMVR